MAESILFSGKESDPDTLESVIGQAVGAASVCWENMEGTGVFQDDRARQIVDDVVKWINERYAKSSYQKTFDSEQRNADIDAADEDD